MGREIARAAAFVIALGIAGVIGWTVWDVLQPTPQGEVVSNGTHNP
jgi:predicted negative regulator of RcsB-dependent stress response